MPHGTPDYGMTKETRTVHAVAEYGEAAIRQGAISSVDRRGNVIWWDDFEAATMKWTSGAIGGIAAKSDTYARSSDYSFHLLTEATTNRLAGLDNSFMYPVVSRIGFELWFLPYELTGPFAVRTRPRDGTTRWQAEIRYDFGTGVLSYLADGGANVPIDTFTQHPDPDTWWPIKYVVDLINAEYVRCMFMDREYDLTGIPLWVVGGAGTPHVDIVIEVTSVNDEAQDIYIDDFILTQNEP